MDTNDTASKSIYKIGAISAISAFVVGILEILITFLPGGSEVQETVLDWFILFQENTFLGLRNMGLLNIFLTILGIATYFALYTAHRNTRYQPYAAIAMIVSFIGVGVFLATNRAFAMLDLSNQYALGTTEAQKGILEAAGQTMLSVGASHTPGTFLAFFLSEVAGFMISIVMLRSNIFSRATAYAGIVGFGFLLIFEFASSFISGLSAVGILFAMLGGLLSLVWYALIARKLFELSKAETTS
ncbi:MAG: hypothetical protein DWQ07_16030 [Chloroflexi bacterium]|nr:MAG: hypothetical protein DWQ07_16030 [Chloroflexota bacterium]MBL1195260.1 hypothetical protein [Chloroflexota bacterium]NOH12546.1 hypothetical protein [Chloroflexota bacterium]